MSPSQPIGVFDSGLGGLSVLNELRKTLPAENFLYLGDVARLPYGTKSPAVVARYALHCLRFLEAQGVKLVVVACNTASASALETLRAEASVDVVGVIEPGVRAGLEASQSGRVLVLATPSTVKSGAYTEGFREQRSGIQVEQLACPLLVPLAEEGWFDHPVTVNVIDDYLSRVSDPGFDVVVLGCTHYPLLAESFRKALPEGKRLVHGAAWLAREVRERLRAKGLLNADDGVPGTLRFLSTDHVHGAAPIVSALFGAPVAFELVDL